MLSPNQVFIYYCHCEILDATNYDEYIWPKLRVATTCRSISTSFSEKGNEGGTEAIVIHCWGLKKLSGLLRSMFWVFTSISRNPYHFSMIPWMLRSGFFDIFPQNKSNDLDYIHIFHELVYFGALLSLNIFRRSCTSKGFYFLKSPGDVTYLKFLIYKCSWTSSTPALNNQSLPGVGLGDWHNADWEIVSAKRYELLIYCEAGRLCGHWKSAWLTAYKEEFKGGSIKTTRAWGFPTCSDV